MVIPSTTVTPGDFVPAPNPGVCPGCGRCRTCGQPAPMVPAPSIQWTPFTWPTYPLMPPIINSGVSSGGESLTR
jgi:hypothetical protein